jgi:VWFA-related protein
MKRTPWFSWSANVALVLGLAVVGAPGIGAQQNPPTAVPQSPPAASGSQQPTFRVSVDLVTTDVIVRDNKGQFVADLKMGDFIVLEDGVQQALASMVLIHGGRAYNVQLPPAAAPPEGIILPPARPVNDAAGRIFIVFVDDLHLDFQNTARVRDLIKKIKTTLFHPGDMFGFVSSGTSSIEIDPTYDINRVDEAAKKIMGGALKPSEIIDGQEGQDGPTEVRYRAHVAFSTVTDMLAQLEKVTNRRKAFIYISNGYDFNPFEKSRAGEADSVFQNKQQIGNQDGQSAYRDSLRQGQQFANADLARELAELTRSANRANTTVYTIDPRGLVGMPDLDEKVDPSEFQNYISNEINSLRVIAEQTGGIAVVNQNDFDKALKRIDAETSDYYMLGYYSSNPDPLKRVRQVDVKVNRNDVDVWSRKSYALKKLVTGR